MEKITACPECGTVWQDEKTCQDHFHQMLYWEAEDPRIWEVHHLMVLCYHLQHPSLYSPETLQYGIQLLHDFVEKGITPLEARQQNRTKVASNKRTWKITGTPESHGEYKRPVEWTMTAADVVSGGLSNYIDNMRAWARSIHEALKVSGNYSR